MKRFFRNIHLYLSLTAGLVIITSCLTGAILVFEEELMHAFDTERYYVAASSTPLSLDKLIENVKRDVPQGKVVSAKVYTDKLRSTEVGIAIPEKDKEKEHKPEGQVGGEKNGAKMGPDAKKGAGGNGMRASHTVFINPYTGKILEVYTYKETFFYQVFALHRWLLGSSNGVGKVITGVSVLIFFFILLTGIILWWPRNAKILKQRLRIKTDASFKRLNHDLHVVLGFYTSIFLFAIVLSAISIAHNWFNDGIYKVTNSSKELPEAPESKFAAKLKPISFQDVLAIAESSVKNVDYYTIRKPKDSASVYNVQVLNADALEMAIDNYYIDQYQPKVVGSLKFADKNAGQQIKASMKSIHLGTFFGISSKTIWLIVSLLGFTFPITGVIMWLKRIKKKRKNTLSVN